MPVAVALRGPAELGLHPIPRARQRPRPADSSALIVVRSRLRIRSGDASVKASATTLAGRQYEVRSS